MDPEQEKKCSELLESFFRLDSAEPFRERVNWEEWGLYDYLQVVKVPMDLGTIRSKLSKHEYKKPAEFAKDMRLVWDNCKRYNQDGSELYDIADELSKRFEDRVKSMKLDVGTVPRADKSIPAPSTEEKIHFSQNIYKVSAKDLSEIVAMLEDKCPKAIEKQTSPDELDIVVDSIDAKTFRELEKFVLEHVPESLREPMATTPKASSSRKSSASSSKRNVSSSSSSSSSKKNKTSASTTTSATTTE